MRDTIHRVAAVQMAGRQGDISYNLDHIKELALEAVRQRAKIIALPEFFTTTIVLDDKVNGCALPAERNMAIDLLMDIATSHHVMIGGSYLEKREDDVYNCYLLVQPNGTISRHDKDIPTMVENAFYIGGQSDGYHETVYGRVGTAMCWETIRTQTVHRLKNRIDFLMTGSHWWTAASNWKLGKQGLASDMQNRKLMHATPGRLARLLGVPNIHAAHCGQISGRFALLPGGRCTIPVVTSLIGETQITDASGNILRRLSEKDGAGVISVDVDLTEKQTPEKAPERFWIPNLSGFPKFLWLQQRWATAGIYQRSKKAGRL